MSSLDLNALLRSESERFVQALGGVPADAPVPTCPEWRADDLLWHLGSVQHFWATIVEEGLTLAEQVQRIEPTRPDSRAGLLDFFHASSARLYDGVVAATDDDAPRWTWSEDQTVGFIRRRQAHEALIHRVDAELTAGTRSDLDPALAADGVEEVLAVMYGGAPAWGAFTPSGQTVQLEATDLPVVWRVDLGRFTGTDPATREPVDEPDLRLVVPSPAPADASIRGAAADLDCWLWDRPPVGPVEPTGDAAALAALAAVVSQPLN